MTVLNSNISWTTGTLNLTVGCTRVSAACDHCYADTLVNRLLGGGFFDTMRLHPERLRDLRKFAPAVGADGEIEPKLVFVNSVSDFWHEKIPLDFILNALHAFEIHPNTIFQILTKRPGRMRRIITDRYKTQRVPENFWLGVTAEDNRVGRTIDILRATKDTVGDFTAFVSVEPITAPTDQLRFKGIDWILTGGESGPRARPMQFPWLEAVHNQAFHAGIALHFKQYGTWHNNPLYQRANGPLHRDRVRQAIAAGEREAHIDANGKITGEKGGATYLGRAFHQKPPSYYQLKDALNAAPKRNGETPCRNQR